MKLYSVDVQLIATYTIKAKSIGEAMQVARTLFITDVENKAPGNCQERFISVSIPAADELPSDHRPYFTRKNTEEDHT